MARKSNANVMTKTCTKTGFTITGTHDEIAQYFYRDKTSRDGFATWCKDAEKSYNNAYHNALKNANANRKRDIDNDKNIAKFNRVMKAERVARGTHSNRKNRVANDNANATKTTTRKSRKFATTNES